MYELDKRKWKEERMLTICGFILLAGVIVSGAICASHTLFSFGFLSCLPTMCL